MIRASFPPSLAMFLISVAAASLAGRAGDGDDLGGLVSAAPRPAPRRPPPTHDISVDDEPEFDVREHDWRFNLQHSG